MFQSTHTFKMFFPDRFILKASPVIASFSAADLTLTGQHPTLARTQAPAPFSPVWRSSPPPPPPSPHAFLSSRPSFAMSAYGLANARAAIQWEHRRGDPSMIIYSPTPSIPRKTCSTNEWMWNNSYKTRYQHVCCYLLALLLRKVRWGAEYSTSPPPQRRKLWGKTWSQF